MDGWTDGLQYSQSSQASQSHFIVSTWDIPQSWVSETLRLQGNVEGDKNMKCSLERKKGITMELQVNTAVGYRFLAEQQPREGTRFDPAFDVGSKMLFWEAKYLGEVLPPFQGQCCKATHLGNSLFWQQLFVFDSGRRKWVWYKRSRAFVVSEERDIMALPFINQLPSCFNPFPGTHWGQFQGSYVKETLFLSVALGDKL